MKCPNCGRAIWKYAGRCRFCGYCFSTSGICPLFKKGKSIKTLRMKMPNHSSLVVRDKIWLRAIELKLQKENISYKKLKEILFHEVQRHWTKKTLPTKYGPIDWKEIENSGKKYKNMAIFGRRILYFLLQGYFLKALEKSTQV